MKSKKLTLKVTSISKDLLFEDLSIINLPTKDGIVGILPGHAEMITLITNGDIKIYGLSEEKVSVNGGTAYVKNNLVTVLESH